jgi:hypothetical protein
MQLPTEFLWNLKDSELAYTVPIFRYFDIYFVIGSYFKIDVQGVNMKLIH